jgi:mono/diheme cytochrome c family protein
MKRPSLLPPALALLAVLPACSRPPAPAAAGHPRPETDYDLVGAMSSLQRWTDKLGRAAAAGNWPLADFYLHEIEEATEDLAKAGVVYHEQPVSQLTGLMLEPAVESLEQAVKAQDAALFRTRYPAFVQTCNACHQATGYGFLRVTEPEPSPNPWNQDFAPSAP